MGFDDTINPLRWTHWKNVFEKDFILIPINENAYVIYFCIVYDTEQRIRNHWTLLAICNPRVAALMREKDNWHTIDSAIRPVFVYFDSLRRPFQDHQQLYRYSLFCSVFILTGHLQ
jgi:Ulp1 family protease